MDVFLHIGPHKTGTTSLQTAFAASTGRLRRAGLLYPGCNRHGAGHHRLAFAMKGKQIPQTGETPDLSRETDELLRAIDTHRGDRILLSSEEFFASPTESIGALSDRLKGCRVHIVTFLRRPDDFLVSCYNQKIKQAGNGFAAHIRRFIDAPRTIAPEISYATCLDRWTDTFGVGTLQLGTVEAGSPLEQLRESLALGRSLAEEPRRMNSSVPALVGEVMRVAKAVDMDPSRQRRLYKRALKVFADAPPYFVSNEDRLAIIGTFEDELTGLFSRHGKDNPYTKAAFTPLPDPENPHNITLPDMMRLIEDLI